MKKLCLFNIETRDKVCFYWCTVHAKMAPVGPLTQKFETHQIWIRIARGHFQSQIFTKSSFRKGLVSVTWKNRTGLLISAFLNSLSLLLLDGNTSKTGFYLIMFQKLLWSWMFLSKIFQRSYIGVSLEPSDGEKFCDIFRTLVRRFWSKFWISLYVLYIFTSPSAQNRQKSAISPKSPSWLSPAYIFLV